MFKSPYWEAAKMAFMVAGGAGVAFAAVKGITMIASTGFNNFIAGMISGGAAETTTTEAETTTETTTDNQTQV